MLGDDPFTAISGGSEEGYPVLQHINRLVDGDIISAPGITGGVVLTTRGGDFELDLGQDLSIGYLSHTAEV
ncbi:encapsulin, partial [Halomonas sp. ND22Bw]|uniref:encapsulin n=1 Tax=Halomonas sp. ND22Bw TaxID=2054178 RepID=UPI0034E09972